MKPLQALATTLVMLGLTACSSSTEPTETATAKPDQGWTTLLDGTSLDGWTQIGTAQWAIEDGAISGSSTGGNGYLVSQNDYKDFELHVEFWADEPANSGVFLRCSDRTMIDQSNAYEVNIYDTRPDQTYRTGSIVEVAPPLVSINTGGQWNTYDITAQGSHLVVILNGTKTVDTMDSKYAMGPIALQYGSGVVKFRSVKIRPL